MIIKREEYLTKIRPFYDLDIIKVQIGSRRSGKSKILEMIIDELKTSGVNEENIIYINFEDLKYSNIRNYLDLNNYVLSHVGHGKQYLFFDEIQCVNGFEKAINSFRVALDCSIFITGSNSKMLSTEISTLLTGRIMEFPIYPFSYQEYLSFAQKNKSDYKFSFEDFLIFGGYPMRLFLPTGELIKDYLTELYNNIVIKDIFARDFKIEKEKFNKISKYILSNAGCDFNAESIYNYLKSQNGGKEYCALSSIYNYLDKLEKTFLIKPIYRFNIPGKQALKSNPKYYAIDNGMRIINLNSNDYDRGKFLENIVCMELLKSGYEVYVGKTYNGEVDFVALKNGKKCFIQVCYLLANDETLKREFDAFKPISDPSPKYVLSLDKVDMSRNGITHINIEEFLLNPNILFLS